MTEVSPVSADMIGKLVRWEDGGQWFISRITGEGKGLPGSFTGEVVDPGTFMFASGPLRVGQTLPNLQPGLITVVDEPVSPASRITEEKSVVSGEVRDLIRLAISDPGHFLERREDESVPAWATRAVTAILEESGVDRLAGDAR